MTTTVNFETSKLLKEKEFNIPTLYFYLDGSLKYNHSIKPRNSNVLPGTMDVSAPTIAEVVYWIYSKYDIWISLIPDSSSGHKLLDRKFSVSIFRFNMNLNVQAEILRKDKNILYFNLPENAFEYAIEYILNTYKPTS